MRNLTLTTFCLATLIACNADAGLVLGFGVGTDRNNPAAPVATPSEVSANIGDILRIDVYVIENDVGGAENRLTQNGLLAFDVNSTFNTEFGTVSNPRIFNPAAADFGTINLSMTTLQNVSSTPTSFRVGAAGTNLDPVMTTSRSVRLFSYELEVTGEGRTNFVFTDPDTAATVSNNGLGGGINIDTDLFPVGGQSPLLTINSITVVPEPSSFAVLAVLGGVGFAIRRRKTKIAKTRDLS